MPRTETHRIILDIDYAKLGNAIADALRLERERVRQGREDPIWETNPKPSTVVAAEPYPAAYCPATDDGRAHALEFTFNLSGGGHPTIVRCTHCGYSWRFHVPIPRPSLRADLEAFAAALSREANQLGGSARTAVGWLNAIIATHDL